MSLLFLDPSDAAPIPNSTSPSSGCHKAKNSPRLEGEASDAVGPVVLMVRFEVAVPLTAGVTDVGLSKHVGASDTAGCTEQLSGTEPVNPFTEFTVTVEVEFCPALTGFGADPEMEKSGATKSAIPDRSAFMLTVQVAVPVHAPLHPTKVDPEAAAVSVTTVPLSKLAAQVLPQLMPDGLLVTVPLPLPDVVTFNKKGASGPELAAPIRLSCWGLQLSSSLTFRVAVLVPFAVGVKMRFIVQLNPALKLDPQVLLETAKSPAFVPVMEVPVIFNTLMFAFAKVAVCNSLLVPTAWTPKLRVGGKRLLSDWQPDKLTTWGFKNPPLDATMVAAPLLVPMERGLKVN